MVEYNKVEKKDAFQSLHIDGNYFSISEISTEEAYGRREITETPINGGQYVHLQKGAYIPRKFTFKTIVTYGFGEANKYNAEFNRMQNNICEVTSAEFGVFNAYIQLKPTITAPGYTELEISCTEVTNEPVAPKYVNPVDTQKAQEEAMAKVTSAKVSSKSTKTKDKTTKNKKSTVTKTKTKKKSK